jgi:hypothetical protein
MTQRSSNSTTARWPFWLLLAAWVCANSPQIAIFAVLTWLDAGRDFSHQQRLTQQVAFMLGGEEAPGIVAKAVEEAPRRPLPPLPPDAFAKKIQLSVEQVAEFLPPALRASRREVAEMSCRDAGRAPPPHGPPRVNQVG